MRPKNSVIETIKTRRSIRQFRNEAVSEEIIDQILEAGLWAPSGLNNQPWAFAVLRDSEIKASLAALTHYGSIIREAPVCIAVFLDHSRVYDRTKDVQAVGASIQNMLLAVHSMGLGAVWLGEILKNKDKVAALLGAKKDLELMAVVALGHPTEEATRTVEGMKSGTRDRLKCRVFLRK